MRGPTKLCRLLVPGTKQRHRALVMSWAQISQELQQTTRIGDQVMISGRLGRTWTSDLTGNFKVSLAVQNSMLRWRGLCLGQNSAPKLKLRPP